METNTMDSSSLDPICRCLMAFTRKQEKMETEITYQRRPSGEKPIDFWTMISCTSSVSLNAEKTEKIERNAEYPRKPRSHTKISSSADGIASDSEGVSRSSRPCRRSRRLRKRAPLSPVKLDSSSDHCSQLSTTTTTPLLRGNLIDDLFSHCFQNIWSETPKQKTNSCAYLNCMWFYMYSMEDYRDRVVSWIKNANIFSKRYVFVPIVLWSHWSLLIFCHLGESLESKTRTPCMLLLDSLHTLNRSRRVDLIRRFISDIYRTEGRPESSDMVQNIPLLVPNVPQQRNGHECGVFVLLYMNLFLKRAPENFSISRGYPYFMKEDWFNDDELERFYKRLESFGPVPIDNEPSDSEPYFIERIDPEKCPVFGENNRDSEPYFIERIDPEKCPVFGENNG